jgi:hypothetical protein
MSAWRDPPCRRLANRDAVKVNGARPTRGKAPSFYSAGAGVISLSKARMIPSMADTAGGETE